MDGKMKLSETRCRANIDGLQTQMEKSDEILNVYRFQCNQLQERVEGLYGNMYESDRKVLKNKSELLDKFVNYQNDQTSMCFMTHGFAIKPQL